MTLKQLAVELRDAAEVEARSGSKVVAHELRDFARDAEQSPDSDYGRADFEEAVRLLDEATFESPSAARVRERKAFLVQAHQRLGTRGVRTHLRRNAP